MAEHFELIVKEKTIGHLETNARELLAQVRAKLADYKPENYSPANLHEAKADKAMLNKLAEAINKERIEIEREFMAPFQVFKEIAAQIVAELKGGYDAINEIVRVVDEQEKKEKRDVIEAAYSANPVPGIKFDQLFEASWLNKGCSVDKALGELDAKIGKIESDMRILDRLNEEDALVFYMGTLDIEAAMRKAEEIKANREALAAIRPSAEKAPVEVKAAEPAPAPSEPEEKNIEAEKLVRVIRVTATAMRLNELSEFMTAAGIKYELVSREV